MGVEQGSPLHPLDDPSPAFLNRLDSEQERAADEFCDFAYRVLTVRPPRILMALDADRRQDMVQEILLHCIERGFRVLRSYRPQGRPFSGWLVSVAANRVRDAMRRKSDAQTRAVALDPGMDVSEDRPEADPFVAASVRKCLAQLSEKCQLLLKLFADGLKPTDMVPHVQIVVGKSNYSNKQASDDLRHCKSLLGDLLSAAGLAPEELTPMTAPNVRKAHEKHVADEEVN